MKLGADLVGGWVVVAIATAAALYIFCEAQGQILILGVTGAIVVWYAHETRSMARAARDELQFMRNETLRRGAARLRADPGWGESFPIVNLNIGNAGPGIAHDLRCDGWMAEGEGEEERARAHDTTTTPLLPPGRMWERAGLVDWGGKGAVLHLRGFPRTGYLFLTLLLTWRDEHGLPWGWIIRKEYSNTATTGRDAYWPAKRGGQYLEGKEDDPLLHLKGDALLDEVRSRLKSKEDGAEE